LPDTKQDVFDAVEALVGPAVPIASNPSALPISLLQRSRRHPGRFLGMHWAELARRLDKDPCLVQRDVPGFIVNRLGYTLYREAVHLLETGVADVETIDRSFRDASGLSGLAARPVSLGPCAACCPR
jgi:3-hydroxybutyryl-CoA dehydrogenase